MTFWRDEAWEITVEIKSGFVWVVGGGRCGPQWGTGLYRGHQVGEYLDCGGGYPVSNFGEPNRKILKLTIYQFSSAA